MIRDASPVVQSLLGSLFTWALTALGAAAVFLFESNSRKLLDGSLGFAAGVMTAASFWSLLSPALEIVKPQLGCWAFVPVTIGFLLGALFVLATDLLLQRLGFIDIAAQMTLCDASGKDGQEGMRDGAEPSAYCAVGDLHVDSSVSIRLRRNVPTNQSVDGSDRQKLATTDNSFSNGHSGTIGDSLSSWRRILLLIIAIVVHNIPEGLAVGVGFGAIGHGSASFESACSLALGIGIQNFPEGLAVSLPLAGFGYSKLKAFFYGQLSGMVEPVAAVLGGWAVQYMQPLLPYSLSFAAGAMIFVVFDDILPESHRNQNGRISSCCAMLGFVSMMALDVGLS